METTRQYSRDDLVKMYYEFAKSDYFKQCHGDIATTKDRKESAERGIKWFLDWILEQERSIK